MTATFYAQILATWQWESISRAVATAIDVAREVIEQEGFDALPTDGVSGSYEGIFATCSLDSEDLGLQSYVYLGWSTNMVPSGRYYAPWSPVAAKVRDRDAAYWTAFEKVANKYDLSPSNMDSGDGLDVYLVRYANLDDIEVTPRCDICGEVEDQDPTNGREYDWNGETGCHLSCEGEVGDLLATGVDYSEAVAMIRDLS